MREFAALAANIEALAARAAAGDRGHGIARAMEDLLCDGYAACLQLDSRIRRLERRLQELAALGDEGFRGDLRDLEEKQAMLERSAAEARVTLAALRERFVGIGGAEATLR